MLASYRKSVESGYDLYQLLVIPFVLLFLIQGVGVAQYDFYPLLVIPFVLLFLIQGVGVVQLVERRTGDRKVASSNPGRSEVRIFFSRVNFVC